MRHLTVTSHGWAAAYAPAVCLDTPPTGPDCLPFARTIALVDALAGVELGAHDLATLDRLGDSPDADVRTLVSLILRARNVEAAR